jgi:hypothetical protein
MAGYTVPYPSSLAVPANSSSDVRLAGSIVGDGTINDDDRELNGDTTGLSRHLP